MIYRNHLRLHFEVMARVAIPVRLPEGERCHQTREISGLATAVTFDLTGLFLERFWLFIIRYLENGDEVVQDGHQ